MKNWWACYVDDEIHAKLKDAQVFLLEQGIFTKKPSKYEVTQYALRMLLKAVQEKKEVILAESKKVIVK